jgi:hypothetical protein
MRLKITTNHLFYNGLSNRFTVYFNSLMLALTVMPSQLVTVNEMRRSM